MVWYSGLFQNFPQFIVIHTVKGFGIVNKAEIDVYTVAFLENAEGLKLQVPISRKVMWGCVCTDSKENCADHFATHARTHWLYRKTKTNVILYVSYNSI